MTTASLHARLASAERRHPAHVIAAISVGNALEWFDIVVYGFLAVTIAKVFFPAGSETVSLLITLGTFGVTFVMRPIGAFVLGAYADAAGRKKALTLSISLMLLGTLAITLAPSYAQIGMLAPAVVIAARLVQGFAAGGEFGSATALLAEQDPARRGFFASWQFASQGLTTLLAAGFGWGLNTLLTPEQLTSWGWRIPFAFGLLIGPVGLYIRRNLEESAEFVRSTTAAVSPTVAASGQVGRVLTALGLIVLATILAYTGLFMPTFAVKQLGMPGSVAFLGTVTLGIVQFALVPYFGGLSDRLGRVPVMSAGAGCMIVMIVPAFMFLVSHPTTPALVMIEAVLGVVSAAYWGPVSAAMSDLFASVRRGRGLAISYSCGVAIFGGFAPFINAWLIGATGSRTAPAYYVIFGAMVSLIALAQAARRYQVR